MRIPSLKENVRDLNRTRDFKKRDFEIEGVTLQIGTDIKETFPIQLLASMRSLLLITLTSILFGGANGLSANEKSPNVLVILADDLGWRDLSNEGSTFYESPHIDRIANEGMKFLRGYANCQVCSPSRASVMTGKYPARLKITDWIGAAAGTDWKRNTKLLPAHYQRKLPQADTTIAEAFRLAGYRTFFAGKWHLGGKGSLPTDHGFEMNVGGHHRGSPPGGFFSPWDNPEMESGPLGELLPLRLGRETASFIEKHKDEKFFAFLSFYSVHAPIQSTKQLWKKYQAKATSSETASSRFVIDRTTPVRQVQDHPLYAGMIESMDQAVGIVLKTLDRLELTDNTIVVFTSDNGGVSAGDGKATSNLPLRGGKGRQWEGGIREPFYIKWPGTVNEGSTCDTPVMGADLYPTLLEAAGIELKPSQRVDGVSLVTLLKGDSIEERSLFWHYPHYGNQGGEPSSIISRGQWKLIHYYEDDRDELYNIVTDVGETVDQADSTPVKVKELRASLDAWLESVDANLPTTNPNFDSKQHQQEQIKIKQKVLPRLEREHANFLSSDFKPKGGWWEETGK